MKRIIFKFIIFIFVLIVITVILILGLGYIKYRNAINTTSISDSIQNIKDKDHYVRYADISSDYINAVVAVEDHRFFKHKGVDFISIVHSLYVNLKSKSVEYGASTITQQLARNLYFTQEKSPIRKVSEIFVASKLEKNYSKEDILEFYLNIIYFGNGYYGIYDASYGYFGKSPKDLTFYEATYLAGLPNAPSVYSENPELAEQRRLQVVSAIEKNNSN